MPGIDLGKASILDAELLTEQLDLLLELVIFSGLSGARVQGVGRPSAGRRDGVLGQGDDVQDG